MLTRLISVSVILAMNLGCSSDATTPSGTAGGAGTGGATGTGGGTGTGGAAGAAGSTTHPMSVFVTSETSVTGDLGGLTGADLRCQTLAAAVGRGSATWHAYLSTTTVNAHDRIGAGPWYNQAGVLVASDLAALHALSGNPDLFVDENGMKINGQWAGSPTPVQHDIMTGSDADGALILSAAGVPSNCVDWTSGDAMRDFQGAMVPNVARVGHADGMGTAMSMVAPLNSWNSAHDNQDCSNTAPRGGAGRIYCFAVQ